MTSHLKQEFENWDQGFIKKTCTQICPFGRLKNTQNQFTLQTWNEIRIRNFTQSIVTAQDDIYFFSLLFMMARWTGEGIW